MTNLPTSYADAVMKDHPQAAKITEALREAKQLLKEKGLNIPLENYRGMANTAWAFYVEEQQEG
jgi:hypothetical protein